MRAAITTFLRPFGLTPARVRHIAQLDCDVYRVTAFNGAGAETDCALRIYPDSKHALAPIRAELEWLLALAQQGVHVPQPLADRAGALIQRWQPDDRRAPRPAVLLRWLPGRMHDAGLTPQRLHRVGVLAGRLHASAATVFADRPDASPRPAYTIDLSAWADQRRSVVPGLSARLRSLAAAAAQRVGDELAALPRDADGFGFVHGDLHQWNIVFARDQAGAIDFSDCGWGHHAHDLASALQYLRHPFANNHDHRAQYPRLRDSLLQGYAQVRPCPPGLERQIETYIVANLFNTLEWILDDWPAPDHRPWGPNFLASVKQVFRDHADA